MRYHYPILSRFNLLFFRIGGPGLGNLLFPLYRAFQGSKKNDETLIFPTFFQLKLGPFLRGEADLRTYGNLFEHRSLKELAIDLNLMINKHRFCAEGTNIGENKTPSTTVIHYAGLKNFYYDLDPTLRSEFISLLESRMHAKDRFSSECTRIEEDDICIHLRYSDFLESIPGKTGHGYKNSPAWYEKVIKYLRKERPNSKIRIFSDTEVSQGFLKDTEIYEVDKSQNALHALLKMSRHKTIVCSRSSFSLWAAFLGGKEIIVPKEFDLNIYLPKNLCDTSFI